MQSVPVIDGVQLIQCFDHVFFHRFPVRSFDEVVYDGSDEEQHEMDSEGYESSVKKGR